MRDGDGEGVAEGGGMAVYSKSGLTLNKDATIGSAVDIFIKINGQNALFYIYVYSWIRIIVVYEYIVS